MDNLIFSLNATVPIFLLMVLGFALRKLGLIDDVFASKMNKFVFLVPLPVLLFEDLSTVDFSQVWNLKFVLFCFAVTLICIIIAALVSFLWRDKSIQGEFIQASYRSSAALLGIAFIQNIYGNAGMAPLMIIGSVPLYNIMAVVVLSFFKPERKKLDKEVWMATLKGIVTNPIILGIVAGLVWSAFRLPVPPVFGENSIGYRGDCNSAGIDGDGSQLRPEESVRKSKACSSRFCHEAGTVCRTVPAAGRVDGLSKRRAGGNPCHAQSATTVSCYVMARNMGHEGVLTSSVVMLTTLFSAFTLTGWLYILRSMGMV